jgi:DNA mismatch repair protein MutL
MPKVMVLADHIASQIAAGEVVERPSSVVKELVENSLDSGASQIEISISSDCRDIRIADDGCGMAAEDAVLAFHRHATSKLRDVNDLWTLSSLGFRGEALPSIASVARVTCYTRTKDSPEGTKVQCSDGTLSSAPTGCAPGTAMEVQDLFYNVPARLNFLKRASTEFGHIQETVQSLAVAYPHVSFALLNHGENVFRTTGSGKMSLAIKEAGLFTGREVLCEVSATDESLGLKIEGFVARPLHFRGDRKGILSIVNARTVRCPLIYKALDYAFSDLIPRGRHPLAVVALSVNPQQLDVNIHPTKKEIKYSNGNEVYLAVQRALMSALRTVKMEQQEERSAARSADLDFNATGFAASGLAAANYGADSHESVTDWNSLSGARELAVAESAGAVPITLSLEMRPPFTRQLGFRERLAYDGRADESGSGSPEAGWKPALHEQQPALHEQQSALQGDSALPEQAEAGWKPAPNEQPPARQEQQPDRHSSFRLPVGWRLAGYIQNTYVVVETPDGMEILEQHILHERALYERLLSQQTISGRTTEYGQRLLICQPLDLSPEQQAVLTDHIVLLERLGFEFDCQPGSITCTQVPLELAHRDYASAIQAMIDQLATASGVDMELEATKSIACQSAIKNGMPLGHGDLIQLIAEWYDTPRNDTCPHGRPVRLKFPMDKLFEMFHPA